MQCCFGIAEIENFLLPHFRKNSLICQTRRRFTRSRANLNEPIRLIVFLLKPIRGGLAPGSPQSYSLPGRRAQKSSGSKLFCCLFGTISLLVWKKASSIFRKLYLNFNVSFNSLGCCYVIVSKMSVCSVFASKKTFLASNQFSVKKHHLVRRSNF